MNNEGMPKSAKLRIERLESSRSGRSLCYVDQSIMESLRLSTGDIIEIIGRKKTAGIVVASFADKGKEIIRIDGIQRLNLVRPDAGWRGVACEYERSVCLSLENDSRDTGADPIINVQALDTKLIIM